MPRIPLGDLPTLTPDEIRLLLNFPGTHPADYRDRAAMALMYWAGMGDKQIHNLLITDIDLDKSTVHIRDKRYPRTLPLGGGKRQVQEYLELARDKLLSRPPTNPDLVFYGGNDITRFLPFRGRALGIQDLTGGRLREAFMVHLLAAGLTEAQFLAATGVRPYAGYGRVRSESFQGWKARLKEPPPDPSEPT